VADLEAGEYPGPARPFDRALQHQRYPVCHSGTHDMLSANLGRRGVWAGTYSPRQYPNPCPTSS
jgi:hypothetical protein